MNNENNGLNQNPNVLGPENNVNQVPTQPIEQPVQQAPNVTPPPVPNVEPQPVPVMDNVNQTPITEPQSLKSEEITITEPQNKTAEPVVEIEPMQQPQVNVEEPVKEDVVTVSSEENIPRKKSKVVPFLVFVIILLIIGIVGMHLYYNGYFDKYLGKTTSSDNTSEKAKTDENNNGSEKKSETTTDKSSTTDVSKLSEDEALKIGNELWGYVGNVYFGAPKVCAEGSSEILKKFTDDFEWTWGDDKDLGKLDETFINQECNSPFGRGSNVYYIDTVLSIDTINENELKFIATSQYCDDKWAFGQDKEACNKIKKEKDFILKKVDGIWKIAKYYLPN